MLLNDMVSDISTLALNGFNMGDTFRLMAQLISA